MINFEFEGLHPSFIQPVTDTFQALVDEYPLDLTVKLFQAEGDKSIGCSAQQGVVELNAFWFGEPIEFIQEATRNHPMVQTGQGVDIPWHGTTVEPLHVLTHEFGHQLQFLIADWKTFAEPNWKRACQDVQACSLSGYALSSADEFWADAFSMMHLGMDTPLSAALRSFLNETFPRG